MAKLESSSEVDSPVSSLTVQDQTDIQAALQGDGEAFSRLIGRYQQRVASHLWPLCRQGEVLEEMVHETFVEAFYSLPRFRKESGLATWLCVIATRVVLRRWKKERRERRGAKGWFLSFARSTQDQVHVGRDEQGSGHRHASGQDQVTGDQVHAPSVWSVVEGMSERDRLVLTLMYARGCTVAQIATLTGWSNVLVKVQAHRARKRLRVLLEPPASTRSAASAQSIKGEAP